MSSRRSPNLTEKLASALLRIRADDGWLIDEPLRSYGTAKEICAAVEWDHTMPYHLGGDTSPQNIAPLRPSTHKIKTHGRKHGFAGSDRHSKIKTDRLRKKREQGAALLRGDTKMPAKSPRLKGGGFRGHRRFDGTVVWKTESKDD